MGKKEDPQDQAIASEPGERVKDWMEDDEENKDFDDGMKTAKSMTEGTEEQPRKS